MVFEYYDKNDVWVPIDGLTENLFFGDMDGYDGSEKMVYFRITNEQGDPPKDNMMIRIVEKYNLTEYPLLLDEDTNSVVTNGNPTIAGKINYSLKRDANPDLENEGVEVIPDTEGLMRIGDIVADTGRLTYTLTVTASSRILVDFGSTLKISEIFFRYFSTNK